MNNSPSPIKKQPKKKELAPENYDTTDYVRPSAKTMRNNSKPHDSLVAKLTAANLPKKSPNYKTLISNSRGPSPNPMAKNSMT